MALNVEREPLDLDSFPANLRKHVESDAATKMKMMAAQGMVPAPPAQTIRLVYQLHLDDTDQVRQAAGEAVDEMPENVLVNVIQKEEHPGVLDWIADRRGQATTVVENLLRNKQTDDRTVARLARGADQEASEVIATNEVRVLRTPAIIERLYQNPNARMATVDRLIELAQRNDVELDGLPGLNRALKRDPDLFGGGDDETRDEFEQLLEKEAERAEQEEKELEKLDDDGLTRSERERMREELDEEQGDREGLAPGALMEMSVPEKIRLATVGSRAVIKKLVQDPNRLVHMAAIESPRLKVPDVMRLSSKKSVPEDVIGHIANNREWTQKYDVVKNLLFNPKTPVADALDLMKRLRNNDLKKLSRSREVPNQVSRQAKRLYSKRTGGRRR